MKSTKKPISYTTQLNRIVISKVMFISILLCILNVTKAQDIRDLEHTLKFADYLYSSKQYILAAEEFERAMYYDSTNNKAALKLFKSYHYAKKYDIAKIRFKHIFKEKIYNIEKELAEEYLKNIFYRKQFNEAIKYLNKNTSIDQNNKETYNLGSLLLKKDWDKSFDFAVKNPVTEDKKNKDLHVLAFQSKQLKYKKPFVAATLSTIVPGTGKMYAKNWKDGIISMIFVGINVWQAYRGFDQYGVESAYGWVFAGFAGSFYLGNIFGSAKAAKKYNKKLDDEIYHSAWHIMVDDM